MYRLFKIFSVFLVLMILSNSVKAQNEDLVQVTGVAKFADSTEGVPYMGVYVRHSGTGTLSNENGLFSLLAYKGDTLVFSRVGFQPRHVVIPADLKGNFYSTTQYFEQDTFVLPEATIRPYMTADEFDYAMRHKEYDADMRAAMRENTSKDVIAMMIKNLPNANGEGAAFLQRQAAYQNSYYGQQAPIGLFNPFKWADLYKSIQNGDYRKKK